VLSLTQERIRSMGPAGAAEVAATDLRVLRAEELRFERRLAFWSSRASELGPE